MDELHTFLFEGKPVRGLFVRLSRGWPSLLSRREPGDEHPPAVRRLLGEMTAAAVLMHANLRYAGTLVLQIFGDGPVKLAVVEVQPGLGYRSTAKVIGAVDDAADLVSMVNATGAGRCAITLDPADKSRGQQPYQGVVDLRAGRGVASVLEHYMQQSEQLFTRFVLAADDDSAGGMLVQRLPREGEGNLEGRRGASSDDAEVAFEHASVLAGTLTDDELLRGDVMAVLRKLYWEDDLRMFEPRRPAFACRCSRERVRSMLQSLGRGELVSVLEERGEVEIACDFCGLRYRFDAVDVGEMFASRVDQPPGSSAIN